MIEKNIDQITEFDLQALIDNSVFEGKTIEYKKLLPKDLRSDKEEFAADISSFANTAGGDLIIGVTEEKGVAKALEHLNVVDIDKEILRIESIIRDSIEPRIPSFKIKTIILSNSGFALVIRVSRSWLAPHRVKYNDKFYLRSSNGKYPMDVSEIRVAFNLSETIADKIRQFHLERASIIMSDETPVKLGSTAKIALHLIPMISFAPSQFYDIDKIASHPEKLRPIYVGGWNHRYNLDGFLTYNVEKDKQSYSYVQVFRNGIIEAVNTSILYPDHGLLIPSKLYEEQIIELSQNYLAVQQDLGIDLPIFFFLDMLGVKGYKMGVDISNRQSGYPIDRDVILLPELIIDTYDMPLKDRFKPVFDSIWNACGFPRSLNYKG